MNGAFSFGSYCPGDSPLHRMDPRAKLLLGCAFIAAVLCAQGFAALGVVAVFVLAFYAISRVPPSKAAKSLAPLLFISLFAALLNLFVVQDGATLAQLGFIRISEGGVRQCLFIGARLVLMMMGMSLITMTTMTLDLTEAFERLLSPFSRIGLPAHELGMIMGIALRFMPQFANELVTIRRAQISRGASAAGSAAKSVRMLVSLMVPLFASAFRHAETLSAAMDARCYHGKVGRTRMHPLHFAPRDGVAVAVIALLFACIFAVNALV